MCGVEKYRGNTGIISERLLSKTDYILSAGCEFSTLSPRAMQGGVGRIAEELAAGLEDYGGSIEYKANVKEIVMEGEGDAARAVGVRLADGRVFRCSFGDQIIEGYLVQGEMRRLLILDL